MGASNSRPVGSPDTPLSESKNARQAEKAGTLLDFDFGFEDKAVGLLTETEFWVFWTSVSSYIKDGKAGWGIIMVREEADSEPSDPGNTRIRVRVFSWGEIIGHLYLAFWILSNKKTERIPMQWVAGDRDNSGENGRHQNWTGQAGDVDEKGTGGRRRLLGCCEE